MSIRVPIFYRAEFRQNVADFSGVAYGHDLDIIERYVPPGNTLNIRRSHRGDLLGIRIPVVGRESVLLDGDRVAKRRRGAFGAQGKVGDQRPLSILQFLGWDGAVSNVAEFLEQLIERGPGNIRAHVRGRDEMVVIKTGGE